MSVRLSPGVRISIGLACLALTVLFAAGFLGSVPDHESALLQGRKELCEAIAIHCSAAAQRNDLSFITETLGTIVRRDPAIVSAAVHDANGKLIVEAGHPSANDRSPIEDCSLVSQDGTRGDSPFSDRGTRKLKSEMVHVPIFVGEKLWGTVEFQFGQGTSTGIQAWLANRLVRLGIFLAVAGFAAYFLYVQKKLGKLQADRVQGVPQRIRDTLNTLAEGVLIVDKDERIALANEAFANFIDQSPADLEGRRASDLPWAAAEADQGSEEYPWAQALWDGSAQTGRVLALRTANKRVCKLLVNSTPILAEDGSRQGVLATFDDLTPIKQRNTQLRRMLRRRKRARAQIRRQNQELKTLAARDPLTSCLNRRSFFAEFENQWTAALRYQHALSCVMLDVDHFKSINDRHGHRVGDQVLQQVAERLRAAVREGDLVCRYGGEEFCILLPDTNLAEAGEAAERFRHEIAALVCGDVRITASLGVSSSGLGAQEPCDLLDQADRALYAAKRAGRNRVLRWDQVSGHQDKGPKGDADNGGSDGRSLEANADPVNKRRNDLTPVAEPETPISFHAVTALVSALAYRSREAAEHSRRVADLCVAVARRLLPLSQCYLLEVAALLHDIGKLGVPDAILSKPGPLTEEEWKVIRSHEQMGEQIIMAAFTSGDLRDTVRYRNCWYAGRPDHPLLPTGQAIPLGARILAIADAFDAMVSDRMYRKGRSRQEAFAELRRCAGDQFDPDLVERFIDILSAHENCGAPALLVSKRTALQIGMQIEKIANAADAHDLDTLRLMAGRIRADAGEHGIESIAQVAAQVEESAEAGSDWEILTPLTLNLLDLCRSTYVSYLPQPNVDRGPEPTANIGSAGAQSPTPANT
jgi:diguanylate cyclase (GGDEF)-like protein/PAS domain S-box-containing protein